MPNFSNVILKRIGLAPGYGYALFPDNWVILNASDAGDSKYAYVFEARNSEKFGVPHFIFFSDICYWDVPARDPVCDRIDALIKQYSKACADAFDQQVQAVYKRNSDGINVFVNADEWDKSFVPSHFMLPIEGSPLPFCDKKYGEYPFGARIVRPKDFSFEEEHRIMNNLMHP